MAEDESSTECYRLTPLNMRLQEEKFVSFLAICTFGFGYFEKNIPLRNSLSVKNMVRVLSMDIFFNIADALEVDPADLINAPLFPVRLLTKDKSIIG